MEGFCHKLVLVLFCLLLTAQPIHSKLKVIFDTDIATDVDDTLALLLLLSMHSEIEVIAIHTVSTNPWLAARMAKKYITLMGFGHIPVYIGNSKPRTVNRSYANSGQEGNGVLFPDEKEYWNNAIENALPPLALYNSADVVIAVGPLTNIDQLFQWNEEQQTAVQKQCKNNVSNKETAENDCNQQTSSLVLYHIKKLMIMGGSLVDHLYEGTEFRASLKKDYNLRIDADASEHVLSSDEYIDDITLVTG